MPAAAAIASSSTLSMVASSEVARSSGRLRLPDHLAEEVAMRRHDGFDHRRHLGVRLDPFVDADQLVPHIGDLAAVDRRGRAGR